MLKRKHTSGDHEFNPETLALGYGYDPFLSEGAIKPPVFLTSTFQFKTAEEGKAFFELAYGLREPNEGEGSGLIYSRLNNPNLQMFEERMATWDQTESGAVFSSGMAAISTTALALCKPGQVIISASPVYGGTHYLFEHILPGLGIQVVFVPAGDDAPRHMREVAERIGPEKIRMLYLETPANPSLVMTDIAEVAALAKELSERRGEQVITAVDNTFLGPVFQRPALQGADLVIYSATKFIGGHSDLIAGVVTGPKSIMAPVHEYRAILGTMATPFSGWLLQRSLETVSVRMRRAAKTAMKLARLLDEHPRVQSVSYPGLTRPGTKQYDIHQKQCTGNGSLVSFVVDGGEAGAFRVLNRFEIFRLAVSLGGTESLAEHPMSMTHADVSPADLEKVHVLPGLVRISVGIEHESDLKRDLLYALEAIDGAE